MTNTDDVFNFQNLLIETFNEFYFDKDYTKLNIEQFFKFAGIPEELIKKNYDSSIIKNEISIPLNQYETLILVACLAPYFNPNAYRSLKYTQSLDDYSFMSLGGKVLGNNKCFYPTGETLLFLLCGHDMYKRNHFEQILGPEGTLFSSNLLHTLSNEPGTPALSAMIYPSEELLTLLKGHKFRPEYSSNFPASRIETRMEWADLILPYETHEDLEELRIWMQHGKELMKHQELGKRIKAGYRTLFYGPPGTGKTLTASLLGKLFNVDVYRIDLSMVVSKWVGETEKNLKGIFDLATNKNWILFFDEADALFGKRTSANSSNDRHANQEVSYLLQRIEDFPGLVILASNLKSNIDEAFNRRFQSAILFPMPDAETRYILWQKAFPMDFPLEGNIDLRIIADKYELAGGAIINIVRYSVLKAMHRQNHEILQEDIEHAIIREFKKEGKIVT